MNMPCCGRLVLENLRYPESIGCVRRCGRCAAKVVVVADPHDRIVVVLVDRDPDDVLEVDRT